MSGLRHIQKITSPSAKSIFHQWKLDYPDFSDSIKKGKEIADAEVSKSLYHRALGYSHPDVDIKAVNGEIVETPVMKHYPPDATSAIFWLKNRQPKKWRDKQVMEHEGGLEIKPVKISDLFDD